MQIPGLTSGGGSGFVKYVSPRPHLPNVSKSPSHSSPMFFAQTVQHWQTSKCVPTKKRKIIR